MRTALLQRLVLLAAMAGAACGPSGEPETAPGATPAGGAGERASAPPTTIAPPPPGGPLKVAAIGIGRSVNEDGTMRDATLLFIPTDTPHVSVELEGQAAKMTLSVRWKKEDGAVLEEMRREINPVGRTVVAFGRAQPGGWPLGKYSVEVLLGGVLGGVVPFEVRNPPL
jgi:hypothetical protein